MTEVRILRDIILIIASVFIAAACIPERATAWPIMPGLYGGYGSSPPATTTCLIPTTGYDGCTTAHIDAQYQDTNMYADWGKTVSGGALTVFHDASATYNVAGKDFPVGIYGAAKTAGNRTDPRTMTVRGQGAVTGGNTLTFTAITNGGTPQAGMTIWDNPGGGTTYYPQGVKIGAGGCTGSSPNFVCTLDQTVTNHSSFTVYASFWPGCTDIPSTDNSAADNLSCSFNGSSNGWTATISALTVANGVEFGPINGHNGTRVSFSSRADGTATGTVIFNNVHLKPDAFNIASTYIIDLTSVSNPGLNLELHNFECDGGNSGAPVAGPFPQDSGNGCVKFASLGKSSPHSHITLENGYVHDWPANPINLLQAYVDVTEQSVVYLRTSLDCPHLCHGAPVQFGANLSNAVNTDSTITIQNRTVIYEYGQHDITAPLAILGGVGSAVNQSVIVRGALILCNGVGDGVKGTCSQTLDPLRVGSVPTFIAQHIFANENGVAGCLGIAGDLQASGPPPTIGSVSNANHTFTWTASGFATTVPLPLAGQGIMHVNPGFTGAASGTANFIGTLTQRVGDPTRSDLHITAHGVTGPVTTDLTKGGTIQPQIVALFQNSWTQFPMRVISGSTDDYIVDDGSGTGYTHTDPQTFEVAGVLLPYGTTDPQTGLPSTAVNSHTSNTPYNGTMVIGGDNFYNSTTDGKWATTAVRPGNFATILTDVSDNWMIGTSGSGGAWTVDGPSADSGACPNHVSA